MVKGGNLAVSNSNDQYTILSDVMKASLSLGDATNKVSAPPVPTEKSGGGKYKKDKLLKLKVVDLVKECKKCGIKHYKIKEGKKVNLKKETLVNKLCKI